MLSDEGMKTVVEHFKPTSDEILYVNGFVSGTATDFCSISITVERLPFIEFYTGDGITDLVYPR